MSSTTRAKKTATPSRRATPPVALTCRRGIDLWAYLDGELTTARARAVAGHVTACQVCARQARRLRAMLEECRSAGCQQLPREVRLRARARVRALMRGETP